MPTSSDLNSHLKEALGLTSARWVALADCEGGKWNLLASQRLTRSMQGQLLRLLEDPAVNAWLDGNDDVAFLPVDIVNSPEVMAKNRDMVTINAALAVDIHGQVVADTLSGTQFSGIGGAEDFVAGPALELRARSRLCLPSTYQRDGEVRSRILPWFEAGTVITTPRHQVDVIITEYGAAELQGLTVHQRGLALAAIAHPAFREELLAAADRASGGRSPLP